MTLRATSARHVVCALLALSLPSACVHIGHGPRVEPGARYFINAGVGVIGELQDVGSPVTPNLVVGGAKGWLFDNGAAASLGVQLPPLALPLVLFDDEPVERVLALFLVDAYVQPQRTQDGRRDSGIGVLASRGVVMPYVQFGSARDGGVFTTQGMAYTYSAFRSALYWLPSLSLRSARPDGSRTVDYYLAGTVGQVDTGPRSRTEWGLTLGMVAEMRRRR